MRRGQENVPPTAVKTIRDLIFWQYSKIISESAGFGKKQFGFVMDRFKKMQAGQIEWSGSIEEYVRERDMPNQCIYCGSTEGLSYDHLIPLSKGGPDNPDNVALACRSCNSSKGGKGLYEWFGLDGRNELPRIGEGKYLKLLYQMHELAGTLEIHRDGIENLCKVCDLSSLCDEPSFTVYCLESILSKK